MLRYPVLVFDWDGTLMDSTGAIVESLQNACVDIGLERPSTERSRYIIGLGLRDALHHLVPDLKEQDYGRLIERYRIHFLARDHARALFAGVPEALQALVQKGHLLAVATGKGRRGLDRELTQFGLRSYFVTSRCADEGSAKPHPGMLLAIMNELFVEPEQVLMIGDTTHDMQMALNAGVKGLAVSYGAHSADALRAVGPQACVDSLAELLAWLEING
jgi:phosphoglycolate phosphatase